nr:HAD family hydrolase [Georgenia yuyongxinii]
MVRLHGRHGGGAWRRRRRRRTHHRRHGGAVPRPPARPARPGAVATVERLAQRWPLGLASSSPRRLIDASLDALGIAQHFRVTVSTEEVAAGKPAPDGYARACELLGVDPARTVAIEDSSNGLRSAAAAGMVVVAVPHEAFPPAADALALAAVSVGGLDEVTVDLLEGLVAAR